MSLPEFYQPEVEAHQIPAHAEAAIGPTALQHRAAILDDLIPRVTKALMIYDCAVWLCFYDSEANINARRELADAFHALDRADGLMMRSAFMLGEA